MTSYGPWFNTKMSSNQYRKSLWGDQMLIKSSYVRSCDSYTGKMAFLCWLGPLAHHMSTGGSPGIFEGVNNKLGANSPISGATLHPPVKVFKAGLSFQGPLKPKTLGVIAVFHKMSDIIITLIPQFIMHYEQYHIMESITVVTTSVIYRKISNIRRTNSQN